MTVGDNAIVHACTVGDRCVIEDNVTILDDAIVEDDVLIEAGSTVFPRKRLEAGWVYAGSPAKPVRRLEDGNLAARRQVIRARQVSEQQASFDPSDFGESVFIARTARMAGRCVFAPGTSLFFSCVADAGAGSISVGDNTNIQDNSVIHAGSGETTIGRDTTIGHNVRMGAVRIGAKALVGIGSILADGTWVQDDVLVAAGSTTEPGQVLESGWMWGRTTSKSDIGARCLASRRDGSQHSNILQLRAGVSATSTLNPTLL